MNAIETGYLFDYHEFDIFDIDGHKYFTEQKPIFYDIATGSFSSLALLLYPLLKNVSNTV